MEVSRFSSRWPQVRMFSARPPLCTLVHQALEMSCPSSIMLVPGYADPSSWLSSGHASQIIAPLRITPHSCVMPVLIIRVLCYACPHVVPVLRPDAEYDGGLLARLLMQRGGNVCRREVWIHTLTRLRCKLWRRMVSTFKQEVIAERVGQ